mmetsp:Transcript_27592/g.87684  ORF Transcript_27592/g.87684 Transcript_27592/m.87684 type:complete len:235 (+) Transcript_27592:769-1473(+)
MSMPLRDTIVGTQRSTYRLTFEGFGTVRLVRRSSLPGPPSSMSMAEMAMPGKPSKPGEMRTTRPRVGISTLSSPTTVRVVTTVVPLSLMVDELPTRPEEARPKPSASSIWTLASAKATDKRPLPGRSACGRHSGREAGTSRTATGLPESSSTLALASICKTSMGKPKGVCTAACTEALAVMRPAASVARDRLGTSRSETSGGPWKAGMATEPTSAARAARTQEGAELLPPAEAL